MELQNISEKHIIKIFHKKVIITKFSCIASKETNLAFRILII